VLISNTMFLLVASVLTAGYMLPAKSSCETGPVVVEVDLNSFCNTVYLYQLEHYGGWLGRWDTTHLEKNGAPIYAKNTGTYGIWYMWRAKVGGQYGWAIGADPYNDGAWFAFKYNSHLVGSPGFWYQDLKDMKWYYDPDVYSSNANECGVRACCVLQYTYGDPFCKMNDNWNANGMRTAAIPSSNYAPSNMTKSAEMMSYPPMPEDWGADAVSGDDRVHKIVAGAAVGAMAVVVITIAVFMIRKRKRGNVPKSAASVHVPEISPTDMAAHIEMDGEAYGSAGTSTLEIATGNEAEVELLI